MAKIILDLSGRGGLLERYQGDLNDTSSKPHLRYLGAENQYAEGIANPFSYYGYLTAPNNSFTTVTGTISQEINSFAYDDTSGKLFASTEGTKILELSDLEDISVADYKTISAGTLKDMVRYELNDKPSLFYIIDSGTDVADDGDGIKVGFNQLDTTEVDAFFNANVPDSTSTPSFFRELVDSGSVSVGSGDTTSFTQAFDVADITDGTTATLNAVGLILSRTAGTGSGITLKVSIQASATANAGDFTSQGAWATSTSYSVNDTVTHNSNTWVCYSAHTSSSTDEPGVGSGWEDRWNLFGAPDGTELASGTVDATTISANLANSSTEVTRFTLNTALDLTAGETYWIVLEESGSNMTASDKFGWLSTANDTSTYNGQAKLRIPADSTWRDINPNGDIITSNHDNLDFTLYMTESENLSLSVANGSFAQERGGESFLYTADNGLLYWFAGNRVNTIDGTTTGGVTGTINEAVLIFPSFTTVTDAAETRGRMYIGVQTSGRSTAPDDKFFNAHRSGVFVWDRRSQVLGGSDFYPTPGAKEIRNLFTSSTGDVLAITINNTGFSELRAISGNRFGVIQTMEKEAYPESRRGISQAGNFTTWLGRNGIFYAYGSIAPGERPALYKIGTTAGQTNFSVPGAIFVGNLDSSNNELAVYFGWSDSGPGYNMSKWYPNGEGSIDSVSQLPGQGDVFSKVVQLPGLTTVRYVRGFHMPGGTDADGTISGTLKCYINQSSTPAWTRDITLDDLHKGWFEKEWNKPNINFIQFEVEWSTSLQIGSNTYRPMYIEIETADEGRINT